MPDMFDILEEETDDELETLEVDEDDDESSVTIPYEYGIDFSTRQLTGEIVSGIDAVKVWAWLALLTARYRYLIYSWEYGCELESLIGTEYSEEFTTARAKKFITECLMQNPYITGIANYKPQFDKDQLKVEFTLLTEFGEEEMIVNV